MFLMSIKFSKDEMDKLNKGFEQWIINEHKQITNEEHRKNSFYDLYKSEVILDIYNYRFKNNYYYPDTLIDPDTMNGETLEFKLKDNPYLPPNIINDKQTLENYFDKYCKYKNISLSGKYLKSLFKCCVLRKAESVLHY